MTVFVRLLEVDDKGTALRRAIEGLRTGAAVPLIYDVAANAFGDIVGSPFAYWISPAVRQLFKTLDPFEHEGRTVRQGLATADDFRFLRAWWEAPAQELNRKWFPFAKGGAYSPFYVDFPLVANWQNNGSEMKAWADPLYGNSGWSRIIKSVDCYFRPGLTWPLRAVRFSPQVLPSGCIFSARGYAILSAVEDLPYLLAITASLPFDYLFKVMLGRHGFPEFIVGVLQKLPMPPATEVAKDELGALATAAWQKKRILDTGNVNSHALIQPALLQKRAPTLLEASALWANYVDGARAELARIQASIDERCFELYGFSPADRSDISSPAEVSGADSENDVEEDVGTETDQSDIPNLVAELVDWLVGCAFGRFDIEVATGERALPAEVDPFTALPICSPGMLSDSYGLPCARPPKNYPIDWPEDGILVDSATVDGLRAEPDFMHRVLEVIQVVWGERASEMERELCEFLRIRELPDYVRKPAGFFADHLRRYSKSRRRAPIYWPLSTASGQYTVWIYYSRLTADTLYKIVAEHVSPHIGRIENRMAQLEGHHKKEAGGSGARATKELGELSELLGELQDMREELLRVANLPYKPDLNDGVQITAAPLWRLFRFPRWRSELQKTWETLEKGGYHWAHLAYAIWPDRVKEKCRTDKSLAIAHGLESLYQEPSEEGKGQKARRRRRGGL